MNLFFLELAMSGEYHTSINACFIEILTATYPEAEKLLIRAEKKHTEIIEKKIKYSGTKIAFKPLAFFFKPTVKTILLRDITGLLYVAKTMLVSKKDDVVFFSFLLPFSHIFLLALNSLLRRKIFICLHGQMEAFIHNSPVGLTKYYFALEKPFFKLNKYGYYIILGEVIEKKINHLFSPLSKKIIIDHPYHYDAPQKSIAYSYPLRIGQIGVGDYGKGTHLMFQLAEKLKPYIISGKLEFTIAGMIKPNVTPYDNGLVTYYTQPLTSDDFSKQVAQLHYSIFLRDKTQGIGVASGSFFDAVKYTKPFISLDNLFIDYYAVKFPGTGYVCSTLTEIAEKIELIVSNVDAYKIEYFSAVSQLAKMQDTLSIKNIAIQFKKQL